MRNKVPSILFLTTTRHFLCINIFLLLTSCYTLNSHQTGKTIGKHNQSYQLLYGVAGVPTFKDENNWDAAGIMLPQFLFITGITNSFDVGATLGLNKLGFFSKYQFVGDQESRHGAAIGLNAFVGLNEITFSGYNVYNSFELPFYLSYELAPTLTIYSSPTVLFLGTPDATSNNAQNTPLLKYNFYEGLVVGFIYKFSDDFYMSLESSYQSPMINKEYVFYLTTGLGIKVSSLKKEKKL